MISVRAIVLILEKLARVQRWQAECFSVSIDTKGNSYLDARPLGTSILGLFTTAARDRVFAVMERFSGCDMHPYFLLLSDTLRSIPSFEINGWRYALEYIADRYSTDRTRPHFFNHLQVYEICKNLNFFFADFHQLTRKSREKAKSFRRIPLENRRRLMQFSGHILDGNSRVVIAHLTIRRDTKVIGGDPPLSRGKSEDLRKKLVKHIKREITDSDHLGHAILLKRDAILGCWMEAFVFFTKNALVQDADVLAKLVNRWNGEIGPGRAGCVGEILFQASSGADKRYSQTLERIVLVTEPDFYSRVSAEGLHRFWCTQSPVGKLAERTRQNRRRQTKKQRAAKELSTPVSRLQYQALANQDLLSDARWVQDREKHGAKIAERRKKAAKTRSRQKDKGVVAASAPVPANETTSRYAQIVAANDASMNPRRNADSSKMSSLVSDHPADQSHRPLRAPAPSPLPADNTPPQPLQPIQLERRPRELTESGASRPRMKVEVRKPRRQPGKRED